MHLGCRKGPLFEELNAYLHPSSFRPKSIGGMNTCNRLFGYIKIKFLSGSLRKCR